MGILILMGIILLAAPKQFNNSPPVNGQKIETVPPLESYIADLFKVCGAKLSETKQSVVTRQLAAVSKQYFTERREQESFLLLLCIESKFDYLAKSKAGAVGYAQVMPKYAQAFADQCGLGKVDAKDAAYPEVNLALGACNFKTLLDKFSGNVALALAGYNSGANSNTVKKLGNLQEGIGETSGYLAKFLVLQEKMK